MILDDWEYKNCNDDRYIYDNGEVPNNNYCSEDGIIAGKSAGKGQPPAIDGVSDGRISEVGDCVTQDDGDDNDYIDKIDGLLPVHPMET